MNRRTRTRLCLAVIFAGLANFLSYTVVYAYINGDAANGRIEHGRYYVRGHFIHSNEGREREVQRWVWIYSYAHSISIWPTVAGMLLAMLTLARPLIVAVSPDSPMVGATMVGVIATLILLITGLLTTFFTIDFVRNLLGPT
ncbi:MAG: hypothetical protein U1A27_14130 [Phycisphaerae bacterium]